MYRRLLVKAIELNIKQVWQFRASLAMEALSSLAYAVVAVIFWSVIYGRVRPLPGWTLGETLAFNACLELFFALNYSVFISCGKFWGAITTGRIDVYLARPSEPRILMALLTMRLENLLRAIPGIMLLVTAAVLNGFRFTVLASISALLVVVLGSFIYASLQMAGSWASFWFGRTPVLDELTDSLAEFAQYPHTIFPPWMRVVLMSVIPLAFTASQPALILRNSGSGILFTMLLSAVVAVTWFLFQDLLWKRGLRRYDSYGG